MENIFEKWSIISKKNLSLKRKMKFYHCEQKHQIKKSCFKFWLKKFRSHLHTQHLEYNIETYYFYNMKKKVIFILSNYVQKKQINAEKKIKAKTFYSKTLLRKIFNEFNNFFIVLRKLQSYNKIIISKNNYFKKCSYFRNWISVFRKYHISSKFFLHKRKEIIFSVFVKNLFDYRLKSKIAGKHLKNNEFPWMEKFFKTWMFFTKQKKYISIKQQYLKNIVWKNETKSVLNFLKYKLKNNRQINLQARNYFLFHFKEKLFRKWKKIINILKKESVKKFFFQHTLKFNQKKIYLRLWQEKLLLKKNFRYLKMMASKFLSKKYKQKVFQGILFLAGKIKKEVKLLKEILFKRKLKFLKFWELSFHTNQILQKFQEKNKKRLKLNVFSKIIQLFANKSREKSVFDNCKNKCINMFFNLWRLSYCKKQCYKYNLKNKLMAFEKNKIKTIFLRLKCFSLLKGRRKEIIKYFQNKRVLKYCKIFFINTKPFEQCKLIKDQMIIQFKYKSKLKLMQKTLQLLRNVTKKNVFRRNYYDKIFSFFQLKFMGKIFREIHKITFEKLNFNIDFQNFSSRYQLKHTGEYLKE